MTLLEKLLWVTLYTSCGAPVATPNVHCSEFLVNSWRPLLVLEQAPAPKVRLDSDNSPRWMASLLIPHTKQSRNMLSSNAPKLQVWTSERSSDTYIAMDSSCCRNLVRNRYLCIISEVGGLWCRVITDTSSSKVLSAGFAGAARLRSNLYKRDPLTDGRMDRFLFASTMPLAAMKCPSRFTCSVHSSWPSTNSLIDQKVLQPWKVGTQLLVC